MSKEIEFGPDDKMDTTAFQIMEKAFGLRKQIFTSHELPIEVLSELTRNWQDLNKPILGHRFIPFNDVPDDDKSLYDENNLEDEQKTMSAVWYPKMTEQRERYYMLRCRIGAIRSVEKSFNIRLKRLKNIDEYPVVTIADVANAVDKIKLKKLTELSY